MSGPSDLSSAGAANFRRRALALRRTKREAFSLKIGLPTLLGRWSDRVDGIDRGYTKGPALVFILSATDVARNFP